MFNDLKPAAILRLLAATVVFLVILACAEWWFNRPFFPLLTTIAIIVLNISLLFLIYRKLVINFQDNRKELRGGFQQIDPLLYLHREIPFRKPLPPLRSYAASPDFLALMLQLVREHQPKVIVEAGSGVSTLINAYLLEQQGFGKVYAFDHEEEFAGRSQVALGQHVLSNWGEVWHAPLRRYRIDDFPVKWEFTHTEQQEGLIWYDTKVIPDELPPIDLLIVDGPPRTTQVQARFPAIPLLLNRLSPNAIILVDDCYRTADRSTVERWLESFPEFTGTFHYLEKGAYVLKRNA